MPSLSRTKRSESPARARLLPLLQGFGLRLGVATVLLALCAWSGLGDAADTLLRRHYYGLRGARASQQGVILVAADDETIAAWGAPPWSWPRYASLYGAIARGNPRAVAVIEPAARVLPATPPEGQLAGAAASGALILPPAAGRGGQPALELSASGAVEAVRLRAEGPTVSARVLARAGLPADGERLPVNFLAGAGQGGAGLPTLPAHRVAAGDIPDGAFAGKIVVFGVTAPAFAGSVPTPVGAMTPAEVHAQALLARADGATWARVPGLLRWLLVLLVAAATLVWVPRVDGVGALALAGGLTGALVLLDYALFATGSALLGASLPIAAVAIAATVARVHERRLIRRRVGELGRWMRQRAKQGALRSDAVADTGDLGADDDAFWNRVAELARIYLDCRSSIVAELPQDRWHVRLRVISGVSSDQIVERRRDVRRNPYRKAHLTLTPVWHPQFLAKTLGLGTLVVPLSASARLYGFWMLNFQGEAAPTAARLQLVQTLAREIALAMERRTLARGERRVPTRLERLLDDGRFAAELDELGKSARWQGREQQEMTQLGENMPFGVLVATLWGEIRYANAAMKELCLEHTLDAGRAHHLPDLLESLTGLGRPAVHAALGRLVHDTRELRLPGRTGTTGEHLRHDYVLARLDAADGRPAPLDASEQLVIVCALPQLAPEARRDLQATTAGAAARLARPLGSSPPAFAEEEVTVMRAAVPLPPPPLAPAPLPPAPQSERMPLLSLDEVPDELTEVPEGTPGPTARGLGSFAHDVVGPGAATLPFAPAAPRAPAPALPRLTTEATHVGRPLARRSTPPAMPPLPPPRPANANASTNPAASAGRRTPPPAGGAHDSVTLKTAALADDETYVAQPPRRS